MLLSADILVSRETVDVCETILRDKSLVVCAAPRTLCDAAPVGASAADLARWMLDYLHPAMRQNFWGEGSINIPWGLFFETPDTLVLRAFHLHPLAFRRPLWAGFKGTCDEGVPNLFKRRHIHVETSLDRFCLAELSPPDKLPKGRPLPNPRRIARWIHNHTTATHRWFFEHRIVFRGDGEGAGDEVVTSDLMKLVHDMEKFRGGLSRPRALPPDFRSRRLPVRRSTLFGGP
jgi:hypothetical protein